MTPPSEAEASTSKPDAHAPEALSSTWPAAPFGPGGGAGATAEPRPSCRISAAESAESRTSPSASPPPFAAGPRLRVACVRASVPVAVSARRLGASPAEGPASGLEGDRSRRQERRARRERPAPRSRNQARHERGEIGQPVRVQAPRRGRAIRARGPSRLERRAAEPGEDKPVERKLRARPFELESERGAVDPCPRRRGRRAKPWLRAPAKDHSRRPAIGRRRGSAAPRHRARPRPRSA